MKVYLVFLRSQVVKLTLMGVYETQELAEQKVLKLKAISDSAVEVWVQEEKVQGQKGKGTPALDT